MSAKTIRWLTIGICLAMVFLIGCSTGNLTELKDVGVYSRTTTANVQRMTPSGDLTASTQGLGSTQAMADPNGSWAQMPGSTGIVNFPLENGVAQIFTPGDMTMKGFSWTPDPPKGSPALTIAELNVNLSGPLSQQAKALETSLPNLAQMNRDAALADVERMKAAGEITATVAGALVQIISKWAPVP
jgi:hypothetical protein